MSLSFLRRFAAGAMIGAAGSFAAACGTLGESATPRLRWPRSGPGRSRGDPASARRRNGR